jgi:hypothetical protein
MAIGIVGLPPDYSYPGDTRVWWKDTTSQAANLGAAFITRSLMRQLDAEFVPVDTPPSEISERYDQLVLSLATHLHRRRDVSVFCDLLEHVDLPVHAFSLGIEDYIAEADLADYVLDPTVTRLLALVSERSAALGCRGPWSASVLEANGFSEVVPFGCPSLFWQLAPDLRIAPTARPERPVCVFHRSLVDAPRLLNDSQVLLGQDFQDQALMTPDLDADALLLEKNRAFLDDRAHATTLRQAVRSRGVWPQGFDGWFARIGSADFVYGPRLHGCIAALASGVPALLLTRDLRTREMVHSMGLPNLSLADARHLDVPELAAAVDLDLLTHRYRHAFDVYRGLLDRLGLPNRLEVPKATVGAAIPT